MGTRIAKASAAILSQSSQSVRLRFNMKLRHVDDEVYSCLRFSDYCSREVFSFLFVILWEKKE